jgi:hypothetical protein
MPPVKNVGEPCAGEPHARFDVGGGRKPGQSGQHVPHGPGASRRPYRDRRAGPSPRYPFEREGGAPGRLRGAFELDETQKHYALALGPRSA